MTLSLPWLEKTLLHPHHVEGSFVLLLEVQGHPVSATIMVVWAVETMTVY